MTGNLPDKLTQDNTAKVFFFKHAIFTMQSTFQFVRTHYWYWEVDATFSCHIGYLMSKLDLQKLIAINLPIGISFSGVPILQSVSKVVKIFPRVLKHPVVRIPPQAENTMNIHIQVDMVILNSNWCTVTY